MRLLRTALVLSALAASGCAQLEPLSTAQALDRLHVATTKVFDAEGNVIANLHGEVDRDIVPLDAIPRHVTDAAVAIEDERFWTHQGVDLRSIARAASSNSRRSGGGVQGGSTISQQLAKNLYFPRPDRTLARKLAEARVTLQLERQYSKREIMEMYLNTIYFGRGLYGIETAAQSYFRKDASDLTLPEGAFLAGLIHEPGRYEWSAGDPRERRIERRRAAQARRNVVLGRMATLHLISRSRALAANRVPLRVQPPGEHRWNHPYFVDYVLRQLGVLRNSRSDRLDPRFEFLGRSFDERSARVYRGGLRIYTSLDPHAQSSAEAAAVAVLPKDLDRLSTALVAIEPRTGYVRAMVGGRDYYPVCANAKQDETPVCRLAKVNLALGNYGGGSGRQPGSSFKPFVLATALERGVSLAQTFSSDDFSYSYPGGTWNVSNYEGSGAGYLDLVTATAHSVNAVFARLEIEGVGDGDGLKGAERVAGVARRMGIGFPTRDELRAECGARYAKSDACLPADDTPSIALGAKEVSPFDMASAYATFANDGIRVEPTAVVRVTDSGGRILYQAIPDRQRVLPAGVARSVTAVLRQVMLRGTATRAAIDRPAAGKTGTSQSWRDAWLAGYVPQLAAVVWVGDPIPVPGEGIESMTPANGYPYRVVGGTMPAMIWHDFMDATLKGVPEEGFAPPPAAVLQPAALAPQQLGATPLPRLNFDQGPGKMPSVIGVLYGIARSRLSHAGYAVILNEACDPLGRARVHKVWAQNPPAGVDATPGQQVVITYQAAGC